MSDFTFQDTYKLEVYKTDDAAAQSLSRAWLLAISGTVARQAALSMGFSRARILEWVAISFSRDGTHDSCIDRWILYHCATREAQSYF